MATATATASAHHHALQAVKNSQTIAIPPFDRPQFENLMIKRFFYAPAFEIYGGVAGLYDYGPPGSALQANLLSVWRSHFIIEEEMLELDTTIMTPHDVLKTSGHVDKFSDWMVKDVKNGEIFRADHLVEGVLEARLKGDKEARGQVDGPAAPDADADKDDKSKAKKKKKNFKSVAVKLDDAVVAEYENVLAQIDNYSGPQLGELIRKYEIKNPETGNDLTEPVEFNLMFDSSIGPTGQLKGYLRPETAQGHFVNFSRLLDFNQGRVPFASAQIGKSFRNEISPRQGLLRVREFTMAEIEHFVDPLEKDHVRFDDVKDIVLNLLPKDVQVGGSTETVKKTIGEAVSERMVDNQTLGYFLGRIHLFLMKIGIDPSRLRFRQHMANEMAHYAADCWDAEIHTSYGWIECVGCADRSAYDLTVHAKRTRERLAVQKAYAEPKIEERWVAEVPKAAKKSFGIKFKKDAKLVEEYLKEVGQLELEALMSKLKNGPTKLTIDGAEFELEPDHVLIERRTIKEAVREFTPNVIEPSFGIGRIFYALLEHNFWARPEDTARAVLSLPPAVAPVKCLVVPLSNHPDFAPLVREVSAKLRRAGIASRVDDSSVSIGKRYSRTDELGTPYGVTLDFASVKNRTMTLRERDTTEQLIGGIDEVLDVVRSLCDGSLSWAGARQRLPLYSGVQDADTPGQQSQK